MTNHAPIIASSSAKGSFSELADTAIPTPRRNIRRYGGAARSAGRIASSIQRSQDVSDSEDHRGGRADIAGNHRHAPCVSGAKRNDVIDTRYGFAYCA
jgi:hypothetical protein